MPSEDAPRQRQRLVPGADCGGETAPHWSSWLVGCLQMTGYVTGSVMLAWYRSSDRRISAAQGVQRCRWPGNVRQRIHVCAIEDATARVTETLITPELYGRLGGPYNGGTLRRCVVIRAQAPALSCGNPCTAMGFALRTSAGGTGHGCQKRRDISVTIEQNARAKRRVDAGAVVHAVALVTARQFAWFRIIFGCTSRFTLLSSCHGERNYSAAKECYRAASLNPPRNSAERAGVVGFAGIRDCVLVMLVGLSGLFALGVARHAVALLLWYGWACLFNRNVLISNRRLRTSGCCCC